jgi:hypothetical protein
MIFPPSQCGCRSSGGPRIGTATGPGDAFRGWDGAPPGDQAVDERRRQLTLRVGGPPLDKPQSTAASTSSWGYYPVAA